MGHTFQNKSIPDILVFRSPDFPNFLPVSSHGALMVNL